MIDNIEAIFSANESFSEKQPVLSAQLLYPLITKESFKRIFDARLFDSEDVQLSNSIGKGEYGQGKVEIYFFIINKLLTYFSVYAGHLFHGSNLKIAAKEINLPLRNNTGTLPPSKNN